MAEIITPDDLPTSVQSHELVDLMVNGANAKASRVAPCLTWDGSIEDQPAPTDEQLAEARLVLIGAIQRWADNASGALTAQTAGPFGQTIDTRQRRGFNLWPSEIEDLQDICADGEESRAAFSVDTAPCGYGEHSPICALNFGAVYCSCAADIAGFPLYENVV